ncbi:MAG: aspartyl/asparaginyl beta-hydroxylase domain-containing protein [Parvularculaceae bacterium]
MTRPPMPPAAMIAAFRRAPRNPVLALQAGKTIFDGGNTRLALAVWSIGDDLSQVSRVKDDARAPDELRQLSAFADEKLRDHFTALHASAVAEMEAQTGDDLARIRAAIWPLTHNAPFDYRTPFQKPVIFYVPDLPAMEVTPNELIAWHRPLEDACKTIGEEYFTVYERGIGELPYVPGDTKSPEWQVLSGDLAWGSIHLWKEAKPTDKLASFPRTAAALAGADLVRISGVPMEAFFSRLRPGAHIPPHYGLTNARLTVHLPLQIPEDCAIKVGDTINVWEEGKIIAFDDSYQHEAWNRSGRDRVVLIFECHHPDLSESERRAIEHSFAVRQNWLDNRFTLTGLR